MDRKVAILGFGSIGQFHAQTLKKLKAEVGVFDPGLNECDARGILIFASLTEALNWCDAVVIASPNKYHFDQANQAIRAHKPTLIEKPVTLSSQEAYTLEGLAREFNVPVMAGHNLRFRSVNQQLKNYMSGPSAAILGDLISASLEYGSYLPDWRPNQDYRSGYSADVQGGGVVWDVIHELDLAWWLLGAGKVEKAWMSKSGHLEMNTPDIASILIRHDSQVISTISLDYVSSVPRRQVRLNYSNGHLIADLRKGRIIRQMKMLPDDELLWEEAINRDDEYTKQFQEFLNQACSGNNSQNHSSAPLSSAIPSVEFCETAHFIGQN